MGRTSKFPAEIKVRAVEDYLSGTACLTQLLYQLQIDKHSFYEWVRKYNLHGREGLTTTHNNKLYPESLKLQAVEDYLSGGGSQSQICSKYKISRPSLLQKWIKKYNSHESFKSHNAQGERAMTKGRKTTYEERVEIVAFCITNNNNYQKAAEEFQVSYQQVYTWVRKYKELGPDALVDSRGKRKKPEEMNESEKLAAQLKLLEAENKRLKMENAFLKKLDEIERRRSKADYARKADI